MNRMLGMALVSLWLAPAAWADQIILKNGQSFDGIITNDTPSEVEVEVAAGATMTIPRADIQRIQASSDDERRLLKGSWETQQATAARASAARDKRRAEPRPPASTRQPTKWTTAEGAQIEAKRRADQARQEQERAAQQRLEQERAAQQRLEQEHKAQQRALGDSHMRDPSYDY